MPVRRHDFEARLHFLSREEGGRSGPVIAGGQYRPDFRYADDADREIWMIHPLEFVTPEGEDIPAGVPLPPDVVARMWVLSLASRRGVHRSRLAEGVRFYVHEGGRVVAEGEVTRLVGLWDEAGASAV